MRKAVDICELSFSYPDGIQALRAVTIEVCEGESVAIIGPNGAGKSTLLLHLNGILRGRGRIRIFETELQENHLEPIRSEVGLVFQEPDHQLFMPTVFDDIAFGPMNMKCPKHEVEARVRLALSEVGMTEDFLRRPSHHLSFGEKRRASIATVLSMSPKILAFDEPSSNMDPKGRRQLINLMNRLQLTKIIATHDLELVVETCSRVIVLDRGRVVATGGVLEILGDQALLEAHSLEMPRSLCPRGEPVQGMANP